ncbi:hypothetical protein TKK_0013781 [Trichogramma kaykai]
MEPKRKRLRSNPEIENSTGRSRKLCFKGNQHTEALETPRLENAKKRSAAEAKSLFQSASASKLQTSSETHEPGLSQYRLIDISLFLPFLTENISCKCGGKVSFEESQGGGLGFALSVNCEKCLKSSKVSSCKKVGPKKNVYEVNRRMILAMRTLGHGLTGIQTLCGLLDLSRAMEQSTYDSVVSTMRSAAESVAEESMSRAVEEEVQLTKSNDLTVSGDGTWRTPGFSSLQGAAMLIGNGSGKVLDVITKNTYCKSCQTWEKKDKESYEYQEWFEEHINECTVNHVGSSGLMEVNGIVEMFQRAEEKLKVRYKNYIGDGDCKVYKKISQIKPFGKNCIVEKKEDINHVGKRMGTQLRNRKKQLGKKLLTDNKTIGGKGRLTGKVIDQLSSLYTKAIREQKTVTAMHNAIWATWKHKRSTDADPQHELCPVGPSSWCAWQRAKFGGTLNTFQHNRQNNLPPAVMDEIKDIYTALTDKQLLQRCIGTYSQNPNESFNHILWKYVPKKLWSGGKILEIGAYMAVGSFNDGKQSLLALMKKLDVEPGAVAIKYATQADAKRIYHSEYQNNHSTKEARTAKRQRRHSPSDDSYVPGGQ